MRILITSIVDLKSSQHNRPHQFVKHLSKKHDITVLTINDWWKAGQGDMANYRSDFDEFLDKINLIHFTDRKVSPILQELLFTKRVKEIAAGGFDVHLNYSTLRSGYVAARRINTVYDIADDLGAMIRSSPQIPKLLRPFGGALGDYLIKRNIAISKAVSVTTDTLMRSYNIPDEKSKIIPNGVDTQLFYDRGFAKREELNLDGFIIGYVGVLREWVDLKPVFLALKSLNDDIKMLIVGREGNLKENMDLSRRCGVGDRVIFTGMVPYSQVPEYISAMDVCLIPFQRGLISENALPLKLFEYMACNRPVISTKLPAVNKVAGDRVMFANYADDYEGQIMELYEREQLRREMGLSGRRLVETSYDWTGIVKQLENVLANASSEN